MTELIESKQVEDLLTHSVSSIFVTFFNVLRKKLNLCIFFTSMPKMLHQKIYIKHHGKYFDVDVDVTSHMTYVMYDVPNTDG